LSTLRVAVADIIHDRHPDVLVEQYPHTNHGCGPHEVVATLAGGRTVQTFRDATLCETTLRGVDGLLALDLAVTDRMTAFAVGAGWQAAAALGSRPLCRCVGPHRQALIVGNNRKVADDGQNAYVRLSRR
jgi:hypothetical protein